MQSPFYICNVDRLGSLVWIFLLGRQPLTILLENTVSFKLLHNTAALLLVFHSLAFLNTSD